jgi:DNA-binding transcriptional ArsR family regulator
LVRAERTDAIGPDRTAIDELHEQFARIGRALANPHRVELLDLLGLGASAASRSSRHGPPSRSAWRPHLQTLRRSGLVVLASGWTRILYRLAGDDVYELLTAVRTVATGRLADAELAARAYMGEPVEAVTRAELLARVQSGAAVVIDLRPTEEYEAGHIAGAISIPLTELEAHLADLPVRVEIVAYCRGPTARSPRRA